MINQIKQIHVLKCADEISKTFHDLKNLFKYSCITCMGLINVPFVGRE